MTKVGSSTQQPACTVWVRVCSICHDSLRTLLLLLIFLVFCCFMCVCVCVGLFSPLIEPMSLLTSPRLLFSYHPRQLPRCLYCILQHYRRAERVTPCDWRIIHCKIYKPLLRHSQQENMYITLAHNNVFFCVIYFAVYIRQRDVGKLFPHCLYSHQTTG